MTTVLRKAFDESAHPRGQPENAGQFAPSEGAQAAVDKAKEKVAGVSKQERAESRQDRGDYLGGADQLIGSNATQPAVVKVREAFDTLRLTEGTDAGELKAAGATLKAAYDNYDADLIESLSKGGATPEEVAGLKKLLVKAAEKREALNAAVVAAAGEVPKWEAAAKAHADAEPDTTESIPDSELPPEPEEPEAPDEESGELEEPDEPERPDPNDYDEGTSDPDYKEDWIAYDKADDEYRQALSAWNKENAEADARNAANEQAYSAAIDKWEADKEKWEKQCEKLSDKWDKTREKEHDVWEKQAGKIDAKLSAATDKAESLWGEYEGELLEIDDKVTDAAQDVLTNALDRLDEEEQEDDADEEDDEGEKSLPAPARHLAARYAEALAIGHDAAAFALGKAFAAAYPELELCVKATEDAQGHLHDEGDGKFTSGGGPSEGAQEAVEKAKKPTSPGTAGRAVEALGKFGVPEGKAAKHVEKAMERLRKMKSSGEEDDPEADVDEAFAPILDKLGEKFVDAELEKNAPGDERPANFGEIARAARKAEVVYRKQIVKELVAALGGGEKSLAVCSTEPPGVGWTYSGPALWTKAWEAKGWVTLSSKDKEGEKHGSTHVFIGAGGNIEKGPSHMVGKKPSELKTHKVTAEHGENHPETGTPEGPKKNPEESEKHPLNPTEESRKITPVETPKQESKMDTQTQAKLPEQMPFQRGRQIGWKTIKYTDGSSKQVVYVQLAKWNSPEMANFKTEIAADPKASNPQTIRDDGGYVAIGLPAGRTISDYPQLQELAEKGEQKRAAAAAVPPLKPGEEPATPRQLEYLRALGIRTSGVRISKQRASMAIDMHKAGEGVGSVGLEYVGGGM